MIKIKVYKLMNTDIRINMSTLKTLSLLACLIVFATYNVNAKCSDLAQKKVLILVSNVVDMGDEEKHDARNNLWEVAPPFHIFTSHGFEVDFASPKGNEVEFMMDPIGISRYAIKYEGFLVKANASLSPKDLNPDDYWGVFIGGGYGPLFDIASNPALLAIIASIYEAGGIIGSSGHGAGAFANVKLTSGKFLVQGKRIAGFPNSTEQSKTWAKQGTLLPFLVESQLKRNGAIALNKSTLKDKNAVVVDQGIVSTLFLPSAALVAKEMIALYK
jgi:putative intracellular protease/amidase